MPYYPNRGNGIGSDAGYTPAALQGQIGGRPRTKSAVDSRDVQGAPSVYLTEWDQGRPWWVDGGTSMGIAFQAQKPPTRIAVLFNPGMNQWAGLAQWASRQWNGRQRIRPPVTPPYITRGIRSISGLAYPDTPRSGGQMRIPAIYVPTSVG